jgi:hypothetical protein
MFDPTTSEHAEHFDLNCHGTVFKVPIDLVVRNLNLFRTRRTLLAQPEYVVKTNVPTEVFAEFVKAINGELIPITNSNVGYLSELSTEFSFRALIERCAEWERCYAATGLAREIVSRLEELEEAFVSSERERVVQSLVLKEVRSDLSDLRQTVAGMKTMLSWQIQNAVRTATSEAITEIEPRLSALEGHNGRGCVDELRGTSEEGLSWRVDRLEEAQSICERDCLGQRAELGSLMTHFQQVADFDCAMDEKKANVRDSGYSFRLCAEDGPVSHKSNLDLHVCFSEFQWDCEKIVRELAKRLEAEQLYRRGCDCLFGSNGHRSVKSELMGISALLDAAEKGHADAQAVFARCCWEGLGCAKNLGLFTRYSKMASDQGHSFGQAQYAVALAQGIGVKCDAEQAMEQAIQSAGQENGMGYNQMGKLYEVGIGGRANAEEAFRCYRRSAALGNAVGHYNCGLYFFGRGESKIK